MHAHAIHSGTEIWPRTRRAYPERQSGAGDERLWWSEQWRRASAALCPDLTLGVERVELALAVEAPSRRHLLDGAIDWWPRPGVARRPPEPAGPGAPGRWRARGATRTAEMLWIARGRPDLIGAIWVGAMLGDLALTQGARRAGLGAARARRARERALQRLDDAGLDPWPRLGERALPDSNPVLELLLGWGPIPERDDAIVAAAAACAAIVTRSWRVARVSNPAGVTR